MLKKKYYGAIACFAFSFLSAQAEIVKYDCPAPNAIQFIPQTNEYLAHAIVDPVSNNWDELLMKGVSENQKINGFRGADHSSKGDGYLSCHYSMANNKNLTLINEPVHGLKYCHFWQVGPKPDVQSCQGSTHHCEIECDTND